MLPVIESIPLQALKSQPFNALFKAGLQNREIETFTDRLAYLSDLAEGLERVEELLEKNFDTHAGMTIGSVLATAITVSVGFTINPWLIPVAAVSVLSAAAVGGSTVIYSNDYKPIHDQLKRVKALLDGRTLEDWAALWEVSGSNDLFLSSIDAGQFKMQDGASASVKAMIDRIGHHLGVHPSLVAEQAKQAREQITRTALPARPAHIPVDAPRFIQSDQTVGEQTRLGAIEVPAIQPGTHPKYDLSNVAVPITTKEQLIARLREECPLLLKLIKAPPIRAVGAQRTGKTTLVKKLTLLRSLILPNHQVIAATPHHEPDNSYPKAFKVVGFKDGKRDYSSISREWFAMAGRIERCEQNSITNIWDEFGLMNKVLEEEDLTSVLTSTLREASKHGERPIYVVHGETAAFLPGSKGLVTVLLSSTVRVETVGELVAGSDGLDEMRPTGRFTVGWLDGTTEKGQIPDWLTEELLLALLPVIAYPQQEQEPPTVEPQQSTPKAQPGEPRIAFTPADLEKMFNSSPDEVEEVGRESEASLLARLKTAFPNWNDSTIGTALKVLNYIERKPNAKANDIKSGNKILKEKGIEPTKKLLSFLVGKGFVYQDGDSFTLTSQNSEDDFTL